MGKIFFLNSLNKKFKWIINILWWVCLEIREIPIKQSDFYPSDWQKYKVLIISSVNENVGGWVPLYTIGCKNEYNFMQEHFTIAITI